MDKIRKREERWLFIILGIEVIFLFLLHPIWFIKNFKESWSKAYRTAKESEQRKRQQ